MSAAAARTTSRTVEQGDLRASSGRSAPVRPDLRVVPMPAFRAPRGPFAIVVGAVLTIGLLGVLLLNTVVAQDAFSLSELQQRSTDLADREQALTQAVARDESPQRLAARARDLGMVRNQNPVFLRLSDGKVLGEPKAGEPVAGKPMRRAAAPAAASATGSSVDAASTSGVDDAAGPREPTALKTKAAADPRTSPRDDAADGAGTSGTADAANTADGAGAGR